MRTRLMLRTVLGLGMAAGSAVLACSASAFASGAGCDFDDDASAGVQGVLTKVSGDGQTARAGAQIVLTVDLVDVAQPAEHLCQKTITWTPGANSGSVHSNQSTTSAQGRAVSTWTLGAAVGTQTVTATVENSIPTLSVTFTATTNDLHLAIVSGNLQSAPRQTALPQSLVVVFADGLGVVGPPTVLTWHPNDNLGGLTQYTTTSDPVTGQSQNTWTLSLSSGIDQTVTVSEPGGSSVTFTALPFQLLYVSGEGQSAPAQTPLPHPLVVKYASFTGTVGPATALTWQVLGGGSLAQSTTTSDAVTGLSQNGWTLGTGGGQSVRVCEPDVTGAGCRSLSIFTATATSGGGSHPQARISVYNGTGAAGPTGTMQTPYDGTKTFGPLALGASPTYMLQVEVGVQFQISATLGAHSGSVTCTTGLGIIPDPNDPVNTGNAMAVITADQAGNVNIACSGRWH